LAVILIYSLDSQCNHFIYEPLEVNVQSKPWVCGLRLSGIVGFLPASSFAYCQVEASHSSSEIRGLEL